MGENGRSPTDWSTVMPAPDQKEYEPYENPANDGPPDECEDL